MDEAFIPVPSFVTGMVAFGDELVDEDAGVRSYLTAYEIGTPVELDISRAADGRLHIGIAPPLYRIETSTMPTFHNVRFRAELDGRAP